MWTLVLFFGASLMFAAIKRATDDESVGVALGAQLVGGAAARGRHRRLRPAPAVRPLADQTILVTGTTLSG